MRWKYKKFKKLECGDVFDFEGNRYIAVSKNLARKWGTQDLICLRSKDKVLVKRFADISEG